MPEPTRTSVADTISLRRRADHLDDLAARIDTAAVMRMTLVQPTDPAHELAARLLRRNILQLGIAVAELRRMAERFRRHADDIDDERRAARNDARLLVR